MIKRLLLGSTLLLGTAVLMQASITLGKVTVESQENPQDVWNKAPRFSWQIQSDNRDVKQQSYQILVATSKSGLKEGSTELVWNSGLVQSDQNINVKYAGKQLSSATDYYWTVQVNTNSGKKKSKVQHMRTTLLGQADWQGAKWIGAADNSDYKVDGDRIEIAARYLRKEFNAGNKVKRATLYISGPGVSQAYINGQQVSEYVLNPLPSLYTAGTNFVTHDVTKLIVPGANAIGVVIGAGHFTGARVADRLRFGEPRLIAKLVIEGENGNVTVVTDESWQETHNGPIENNNEFDGEIYDARKDLGEWTKANYNGNGWTKAGLLDAPTQNLRAQMSPGMSINETIKPVSVNKVGDKRYIVDMGQNFTGWVRATLNGTANQMITLRYAESLQNDGKELYTANLRSARNEDRYFPATNGVFTYEPTLTFHGGRYVEISGVDVAPTVDDIVGCMVYDQMAEIGKWESSNNTLNKIYNAARWGIAGNYKGMPVDCPQRDERFGWLGDRATGCYGESYVFNNSALYNKWLLDIEESMSPEGDISDVSPRYVTLWNTNVTWPSAYIYSADMLMDKFGDTYSIENRYDSMRKWLLYIKNKIYRNGILIRDRWGDWCVPPEKPELIHSQDPERITNQEVLSTTVYYDLLKHMIKFATITGHTADTLEYSQMRAEIRKAYNDKYYNAETGGYSNNTVTANLLSLDCGLVDKDRRAKVVENIMNVTNGPKFNGHISTGVVGVQHLMRGLSRNGNPELAYKIATNETYPSWGYMINNNATTIWELWNGNSANPAMNSGNHVMLLGDLIIWMYEDLAGIRNNNDNGSIGFKQVLMQPAFPEGLTSAKASYEAPTGTIKSYWDRKGDNLTWFISIPANSSAKVVVPSKFNIAPKAGKKGVRTVKKQGANTVIELGSGSYQFVSNVAK